MKLNRAAGFGRAALWGSILAAGITIGGLLYFSVYANRNPIQELQELPVGSAVRLMGVVTYTDGPGNRFWIEDESGAVPIPVNPARAGVRVGETVRVRAVKAARYDPMQGPASVALEKIRISTTVARVRLPQPATLALPVFPSPEKNGIRVRTISVVQGAGQDAEGRPELFIGDDHWEVEVRLGERGDPSRLVNALVRIEGIPEERRSPQGAVLSERLWANSANDLEVIEPAPATVPLYSIRSLWLNAGRWNGHKVRIRGVVTRASRNSILVEDRWGAIECHFAEPAQFAVGTSVEAEGFPRLDVLKYDLFHAAAREIPPAQVESAGEQHLSLPVLSTVGAVRRLEQSQAAQGWLARLDGVITYNDPMWLQLWMHDGTGGIFLKYSGDHPEFRTGARVQVTGVTNPGNFAPVVVAPKFSIVGSAPLPEPIPVNVEGAAAGKLDGRYVTIEGVVHPIHPSDDPKHPIVNFDLYTVVGQVHVDTTPEFSDLGRVKPLEDARVRIRGVFSTIFNSRRQLVGYQLLIARPSDIEVLEPATNLANMEVTPVASLLSYSAKGRYGHRVKVEGTITLAGPDFLYLQDSSGGVEVHGNLQSFQVGDVIGAVGYPTLVGGYSPELTDAVLLPTGRVSAVPAKTETAESMLDGHADSMLVTLQGKVLMALEGPGRKSLVMQAGTRTFTAQLDTSETGGRLGQIGEGSVLILTGVCSMQVDPARLYRLLEEDPSSFQILLRSPEDLTVIRPPSFWTVQRTMGLLGLACLGTMAMLVWAGRLRHRVRAQAAALERASETERAIADLSDAMQKVSDEGQFDAEVSLGGSDEIAPLVVGFNRMIADLRERDHARKAAEAKLERMALFDELTGLPNRRLLFDRLAQSLARARRECRQLALLYIDLDGFKLVNDNLGHRVGDLLLAQVAHRLRTRSRESDTVARIGGDEFTVVLDQIAGPGDAEVVAQELLELLRNTFEIEGHTIQVGACIGISIFPEHGNEGDFLLQQADCAMYAAKRNGKNCVVQFGDSLGNAARERLTLESDLRRAIVEGEIHPHYQPELNLNTRLVTRFEALARWNHPALGAVPPGVFIPVAEESNLIIPLGAHIMKRACREALGWQILSNHPVQVAVNVSSVQFARETFISEVEEILHSTGLDPHLLQIELTESATLIGIERAGEIMNRLKRIGVTIAVDDFGTGYSCLSYLPKLPFDVLKIDRSFVNELMVRRETRAFVKSILTMADSLGMRVVVEGVETEEQLHMVMELGIHEAQGFLLGRPSPDPAGFLRRLQARSSGDSVQEALLMALWAD